MRKAMAKGSKLARKPTKPYELGDDKHKQLLGLGGNENALLDPDDEDYMRSVVEKLEQDLARRQESYVRRERQYQVRIEELEKLLTEAKAKKASSASHEDTMCSLRQVHKNILGSIAQVQERTGKILQEQEKDLLRAFRARLYSVQEELETEKNKTDDGASAWIDKSKQLETEVEWTKEMADRLDRLNQSLTRENQRLKTQFSMQENDREFLVRQLVSVKKDNVRLRKELTDALNDNSRLKEEGPLGDEMPAIKRGTSVKSDKSKSPVAGSLPAMASHRGSSAGVLTPNLPEVDNRYKEIIKRLKRVLEVERRNLRQVRSAYTADLQTHTELSMFLKQCIEDVKAQITDPSAVRHLEPMHVIGTTLTGGDRQRVIDVFLSQERVLSLLYAKAFPLPTTPIVPHDDVTKEDIRDIFHEAPVPAMHNLRSEHSAESLHEDDDR
ncbi:hypothetical protein SDRG_01944 [Saprolegnia diclina VS20]|uniref:Cilia- and flagella-associated protein 157 n=1 Tax=Saprolegnia diclina (strain VS20) TaxID=1156394 RepID=T0QRW3_SAPDV|nr:hypothetical protein SDRG_01944 [Saprolegnia diclina VS20]EQC40879.1 hypothetical protein SDRG_01944 [Saprolegnia diclina VS20]|eukprot:XP_008605723.1 hypothetical protein SDRG_01944 [Saprolegnia diclina VS20]